MPRTRWEQFTNPREVPRRGGIYALYDTMGELIYIGSSGNVRTRVVEHWRKPWGVIAIKISFMPDDWYRREQRLVRRLRPQQNQRVTYHNLRNANC